MFSSKVKATQKLGWRHVLLQMLSLAQVMSPVVMIWFGLVLVTNTQSPIVVVLSESMEPAFSRGDILFLVNPANQPYDTGDIVVYNVPGAKIPIVHRVLETHSTSKDLTVSHQLLLTKGDNNPVDDLALYRGLEWLERKHIVGKVRGLLPYVGYMTIATNDDPRIKYALFGVLSLVSLV